MIHPFSQPLEIKTHLREEQLSEIQSVSIVVASSEHQKLPGERTTISFSIMKERKEN